MTSSIQRKDRVQTESKADFCPSLFMVCLIEDIIVFPLFPTHFLFSFFFLHSLIVFHLFSYHSLYISCLTCSFTLPIPSFVHFSLYRSSNLLPISSLSALCPLSLSGCMRNWSSFLLPAHFQVLACPKTVGTITLSLGRDGALSTSWLLTDFLGKVPLIDLSQFILIYRFRQWALFTGAHAPDMYFSPSPLPHVLPSLHTEIQC